MNTVDSSAAIIRKIICVFAVVIFLLFGVCEPALAYDDSYASGDWGDAGELVSFSKKTASGFLRYYIDDSAGCAYFILSVDDTGTIENQQIFLTFTVKNSANTYIFSVGKNGVIADAKYNIDSNFDVYYDFSKMNVKYGGGEAYVAFELKNTVDKKLDSQIKCEYNGSGNYNILTDAEIKMLVTTTAKTTKATTEKTTKATTEKTAKTTTEKTTKATTIKTTSEKTTTAKATTTAKKTTEKSTKFVPSGTVKTTSAHDATTKFSPSYNTQDDATQTTQVQTQTQQTSPTVSNSGNDGTTSQVQQSEIHAGDDTIMSGRSRTLFAVGVFVLLIGIVLTIIGAVYKDKKQLADEAEADSSEQNSDKDDDEN